MNVQTLISQIRGQLIVSCQALPDEPLHGSYIMAKMAVAAKIGGAAGIRANGPDDIRAIKAAVALPVIGLYKDGDTGVYITPTLRHVREIIAAGADVVALDATDRTRPDGGHAVQLIQAIKAEYSVPILADVSTFAEGQAAQEAGAVLTELIARIRAAGVRRVQIHARKAWLQGLSPKDNREIPPLDYGLVQRMKARFPDLHISINGGITSLDAVEALLASGLDGVMIGRAAYHQPADLLCAADRRIFGATGPDSRAEAAVLAMLPYIEAHLGAGGRLNQITRHMLGLFAGRPGARAWRRLLSEGATRPGAGTDLVERALAEVMQPA